MSEKYSITGKVTGILCEDTVSDNETSGDKLLRSERMVYTNEAVPDSRLQESII